MELDVVFRSGKLKLVGVLVTPPGNEPCPGIILCHGFMANKDANFFPELTTALVAAGFAVLRFDCRACGKSEGDLHPTYKTMVVDLKAAIDYMSRQERITTISLAGHSMGGASVIAAASEQTKAIVAFAAVAYPFDSAKAKRDVFTKQEDGTYTFHNHVFTESWFDDAKEIKPLDAIASLKQPILIIHGTADKNINLSEGKQLFLTAKIPKSIKMIEGADHLFTNHYASVIKSTVSFFKLWLLEKKEE